MVSRLEDQRTREGLEGGFDRVLIEERLEEGPEQSGVERVARENGGEEDRKRASTAGSVPAIGTEDALTAFGGMVPAMRVIPKEDAMTIEGLGFAAARASQQLQGKRTRARSTRLSTKRGRSEVIGAIEWGK